MANAANNIDLPQSLRTQFAGLRGKLWRRDATRLVVVISTAILAGFFAQFLADRFGNTPIWLRSALFALVAISFVMVFAWWVKHWVVLPPTEESLSRLIRRRNRSLGDRLLGIVELAHESNRPPGFSEELYRAAIVQVADAAAKHNFDEAAVPDNRKRLVPLGLLLVFFVCALLLSPRATGNAFARLLVPGGKIDRYTLVQIGPLPEQLIVAHGEEFGINVPVRYRSMWRPSIVKSHINPEFRSSQMVQNGGAVLRVLPQTRPGELIVKSGDAIARVKVQPEHRPALKDAVASVQMPEYLRYPAAEEPLKQGTLSLLPGSKVQIAGEVTRPLVEARMDYSSKTNQLPVEGPRFRSETVQLDGMDQVAFSWTDQLGLSVAKPWKINIQQQRDLPPTPEIQSLPREIAILQTDVLEINVAVRDDFGVQDYGLNWEVFGISDGPVSATTGTKVMSPSPQAKTVERKFRWSPSTYRVAPDSTVELFAYARDYLPGRERTVTPSYRIHVLDNQKHAELVRQKLEALLARVEEITRTEEKILAKTLDARQPDKIANPENSEKLATLAEEQNQNAKDLEQIAKDGLQTLAEALRNPVIPPETVQEAAKNLQQMQKLSTNQMQQASKSLKNAQQAQQSPGERKEQLDQAAQKEEETLQELAAMQRKVNEGLDDLQAFTLAQRLRRVAETEKEIQQAIHKIVPHTIGLLPGELPDQYKKVNSQMAIEQGKVHDETDVLTKEISRFFERTRKRNYGEVSTEMKDSRATEELDKMRANINENIVMETASHLVNWSKKFDEWATKLEPPKEDGNSQSGEGQSSEKKEEDMTKVLIALLRLREKELNLKNRTALLDENKETEQSYKERAALLSKTQENIWIELKEIEGENRVPMLMKPYQEVGNAMADVQQLLAKPQTDKVTEVAQAKAVEVLTDVINLINEQAQRKPPSQSQQQGDTPSEDMAFLMQMMKEGQKPQQGMAMNPGAGPNQNGGESNSPSNAQTPGENQGEGGPTRSVGKSAGSAASAPAEFRQALENYYKALESAPRQ